MSNLYSPEFENALMQLEGTSDTESAKSIADMVELIPSIESLKEPPVLVMRTGLKNTDLVVFEVQEESKAYKAFLDANRCYNNGVYGRNFIIMNFAYFMKFPEQVPCERVTQYIALKGTDFYVEICGNIPNILLGGNNIKFELPLGRAAYCDAIEYLKEIYEDGIPNTILDGPTPISHRMCDTQISALTRDLLWRKGFMEGARGYSSINYGNEPHRPFNDNRMGRNTLVITQVYGLPNTGVIVYMNRDGSHTQVATDLANKLNDVVHDANVFYKHVIAIVISAKYNEATELFEGTSEKVTVHRLVPGYNGADAFKAIESTDQLKDFKYYATLVRG